MSAGKANCRSVDRSIIAATCAPRVRGGLLFNVRANWMIFGDQSRAEAEEFSSRGALNITSSGIFSNTAASGSGRGGRILNGSGTMTIVNSTFYLNTANRDGGGIYSKLHSQCYNLIEAPTDCLISGSIVGNITGQDPLLGPLQFNGGPTQTQSPLVGSPAINFGQTPSCTGANLAPLSIDQRGSRRPINNRCDIGAVEVGMFLYLPLIER